MNGLPFPLGRFTEAEWLAAYRQFLSDEEATGHAADLSMITEDNAWRIDISEVDLAYLSLVSADLSDRVARYRRDVYAANGDVSVEDRGLAGRRELRWEQLRAELRKRLER